MEVTEPVLCEYSFIVHLPELCSFPGIVVLALPGEEI